MAGPIATQAQRCPDVQPADHRALPAHAERHRRLDGVSAERDTGPDTQEA
ncbi:hypothetical protein [Saccharomonospora sp. NB11]|nr:hypothetical protein [Saccharomonospora sp. NB11]